MGKLFLSPIENEVLSVVLLILTTVISILSVLVMPKRISWIEMYTTSLFVMFLGSVADIYLDVKYDLYGFFTKGVDFEYLLIFIFVYPATNSVFLNFYPQSKSLAKKALYITVWVILTTLFEYISAQTEVFYYNEWKTLYSFFCYPFLYIAMVLNLKMIRRLEIIDNQK
ncbi:CBO0543 family protein [Priestia megaterium]|uniref:CBO0543 family protein n=1 Tax=Priestia megaterium TaxID=1404 RepID=UPI001401DB69|nr:CBO0543 family protein [Priestia megaterium]